MPELPEVETITKVLIPLVKGKTIERVEIIRDCTVEGDSATFCAALKGRTYQDITRIGKFIIFHFDNDVVVISHLRMEGKYYLLEKNERNSQFARMLFHLNDGTRLCYDDSRCFGMMKLSSEQEYRNVKDIAQLGPEPFYVDDVQYLLDRNKKSNHPIKATLLDQTLMAGIGNIYADEICFACKIHPLTPAKYVTKEQWIDIVENAKRILKEAIEQGGSTIKSYHPGKSIDGNFQVRLKAYGRADKECSRCGHIMRFTKVNGRGTTFCPHCQNLIKDKITVGIFGPVGSGKSTVANRFKEAGYDMISADDVVHELYKEPTIANKVAKMFSLSFKDSVDFNELRTYLVKNPKELNRLERFIHPLVGTKIKEFLDKSLSRIVVAEVPLLYQSGQDSMFDFTIGVTSKKSMERLINREKNNASSLAKINASKTFEESNKKADFVIYNDLDLDNLYNSVDEVINKLISHLS